MINDEITEQEILEATAQQEEYDYKDWASGFVNDDKEGIAELFNKALETKDSTKSAFLNQAELGNNDFSVRSCKRLALIFRQTLPYNLGVAEYFEAEAEHILATSVSRKGWFVEAWVSMKKITSKLTGSSIPNISNPKPNSWVRNTFNKNGKI